MEWNGENTKSSTMTLYYNYKLWALLFCFCFVMLCLLGLTVHVLYVDLLYPSSFMPN